MELLYLSRNDVEKVNLSMAEILEAVDTGFRMKGLGKTEMPPKPGIHTQPDSFIHAMPAYIKEIESAGMKWVSGYPANPSKGLPYINGLLILNDPNTGLPLSVMDCSWITATRTGASVGISSKYLAHKNASIAGLVACGVQAISTLDALVETTPHLREIKIYDILKSAVEKFIQMKSPQYPQLTFTICNTPEAVTRDADIVVTSIPIVTKPSPPLSHGLLKEGALAVSLDYDSAWTSSAMKECDKFVSDDIGQLLSTKSHGVYFSGIPDKIYADIGELACGNKVGRENDSERIFSMNMGIAVDDMATAIIIYKRALEKGIGTKLPL